MKTIFGAIIIGMLLCSCAGAAELSARGADKIQIKEWFEAPVQVAGWEKAYRVEIAGGKLPYGLRLTDRNTVAGYPAGIERTVAKLRAVAGDGEIVESEISFSVVDSKFRLVYQDLPVAALGKTTTIKIEGQGGTLPVSDCAIKKARTFTDGGAALPGAKAPSADEAPAWLKISGDCTITATPDKEAEVLLIVTAKDAAGASADEFYALRSASDIASQGWLEMKAREYNVDYQNFHSPYGLSLELNPAGYSAYGDSAMWTGTYLAGAAYFYAVTHENYARANLEKALAATTRLREITGVPGLIARGYEFDESKRYRSTPDIQDDPAHNSFIVQSGPYKGWRVLSTASRDQFTGVLWGNATVYDLFDDPGLKGRAQETIVSMASHIWNNKMHIKDRDGKRTRHGVMSGWGISDSEGEKSYDPYANGMQMANGFNSALILNWFDMAATVAPDDATKKLWRGRYLDLIGDKPNPAPGRSFEKGYLGNLKTLYVFGESYISYWDTVWFNLNLLFNNYYHLARYEKDPSTRQVYRDTLKWLWDDKEPVANGCDAPEKRRAGREMNPHFTWQYMGAEGDRDPGAIFNAVSEMITFPRGPRSPFKIIDPIDIKAVPGHPKWACEPIPIQYRFVQDFMWQRGPYDIGPTWDENDPNRSYAGVDVVTPYWMGRYFGYIPGYL